MPTSSLCVIMRLFTCELVAIRKLMYLGLGNLRVVTYAVCGFLMDPSIAVHMDPSI